MSIGSFIEQKNGISISGKGDRDLQTETVQ